MSITLLICILIHNPKTSIVIYIYTYTYITIHIIHTPYTYTYTHIQHAFLEQYYECTHNDTCAAIITNTYPTIVLIHANNAYGFAKNRRFTEENVDLNRNFLTLKEFEEVTTRNHNFAGMCVYMGMDGYTLGVITCMWLYSYSYIYICT